MYFWPEYRFTLHFTLPPKNPLRLLYSSERKKKKKKHFSCHFQVHAFQGKERLGTIWWTLFHGLTSEYCDAMNTERRRLIFRDKKAKSGGVQQWKIALKARKQRDVIRKTNYSAMMMTDGRCLGGAGDWRTHEPHTFVKALLHTTGIPIMDVSCLHFPSNTLSNTCRRLFMSILAYQ